MVISLSEMSGRDTVNATSASSIMLSNETDFNVLVIREGTAFIEKANCQNQVCVHSKPISYTGETITCLPHRIQVSIEGGEKQEYDTITN